MNRKLRVAGWLTVIAAATLAAVSASRGQLLILVVSAACGVVVATTLTRADR